MKSYRFFGGHYGMSRFGFTFNEGAGPVNLTVLWRRPGFKLFFYINLFGKRWSYYLR